MTELHNSDVNDIASIAQSIVISEIDTQEQLIAQLRAAVELNRETVRALREREVQIAELIEENQLLRQRAAGIKG